MQARGGSSLCEPGMTRLLRGALGDCKAKQTRYNTLLLNGGMFLLLICVIGAFLYYRYRGRLTPEETAVKKRADYEHIVGRLGQMQVARDRSKGLITKLPLWDTRAAAAHLR